jgi:hypothetical protein
MIYFKHLTDLQITSPPCVSRLRLLNSHGKDGGSVGELAYYQYVKQRMIVQNIF